MHLYFWQSLLSKKVQIVNSKCKIHTSLVKRRVNEDDSKFFKQAIQVSSLFFFSNRLSIYCFFFYTASCVDCLLFWWVVLLLHVHRLVCKLQEKKNICWPSQEKKPSWVSKRNWFKCEICQAVEGFLKAKSIMKRSTIHLEIALKGQLKGASRFLMYRSIRKNLEHHPS